MDPTRAELLRKVARAISEDAYVDEETGSLRFGSTVYAPKWEGEEGSANLSFVRGALDQSGLGSVNFDLLQLAVVAQVPHRTSETGGELAPGDFPDQLAVIERGGLYSGLHQLDLVSRNPAVMVTEIQNGIAAKKSSSGV